jgi:DNA gyrase subunit B/topoisomerase-4 subunit B
MNLVSRLLPAGHVVLGLDATSKKRLFEQVGLLFENSRQIPRARVFDSLFERERLGSTALGCGVGAAFDITRLRYHRVVLLADADSDGHHITTRLLTFLYRHLPQLIQQGRVFVALPPLYRIDIGKETYWAADEADKERILREKQKGNAKADITRFKGLGEMMPKVLWETTLNPKTRRLLRVEIQDALETDRIVNELMGKDASARFRFIMDRADQAEELDV